MQQTPLPYADLTLVEALETFRTQHGLNEKYRGMREEAQMHFERHDMVHVLFGLDTSLRQEAMADGWTIFGTDISWKDIREFYDLPEEKEVVGEIGCWTVTKAFIAGVPDFARIAWRSRRLRKKWSWSDNADYRDRKLAEIRREFSIVPAMRA